MKKSGIKQNRRAFTLIELLVVISIIALLVAVLMPALGNARKQATGAVCLSNVKSLSLAWCMYADDNDGNLIGGNTYLDPVTQKNVNSNWVLPPVAVDPVTKQALTPLEQEVMGIKLGTMWKYSNVKDIYHCPGDKRDTKASVTPQNPFGWLNYRSYGMSGMMNGEVYTRNGKTLNPFKKIGEIKTPASKLVFPEEVDDRGYNKGSWIMGFSPNSYEWIDPLPVWHNKQSTLGFADGHAEMHRWEDPRTVLASENMKWGEIHNTPPSKDWIYMYRIFAPRFK